MLGGKGFHYLGSSGRNTVEQLLFWKNSLQLYVNLLCNFKNRMQDTEFLALKKN